MFERLWRFIKSGGPEREPGPTRLRSRPASGRGAKPAERGGPLTAAEASPWLRRHRQAVVLDVRTAAEFAAGHIRGARHLDYFDPRFQERLVGLDRAQTYLVHCASGRRGARARLRLMQLGFESVYHLEGGLRAWVAAGHPLVGSGNET